MSIKITIEQAPDSNFKREMLISRVSDLDAGGSPTEDIRDRVFEYEVVVSNRTRVIGGARFTHRYGDDLFILATEAIAAFSAPKAAMPLDFTKPAPWPGVGKVA